MDMRKIELGTFMKWAFGEELVHLAQRANEGGGGWNYIAAFGALGTVIDGGGYASPELSRVHPDAIVAGEAVMLLAREDLSPPVGWNPFPDLADPHGLIADAVNEVQARRAMRDGASLNANLIALVISCAVMGKEPEWRVQQPKFRMVSRNGEPMWFIRQSQTDTFGRVYEFETDGFNPKSRRPRPGAYRKYELAPGFSNHVQTRIDWYLWSKAMELVAARLVEGLTAHQITMPKIDCEIWKNSRAAQAVAEPVEMVEE
jgi:hypothetical protein